MSVIPIQFKVLTVEVVVPLEEVLPRQRFHQTPDYSGFHPIEV